jgi:hypothetical protein
MWGFLDIYFGDVTMTQQSQLTEATFAPYLKGFSLVSPQDLLSARGGRVRYVTETLDSTGRVTKAEYRLGGWLKIVDSQLRYLRLFNPYANQTWSVQLQKPGTRVRLYYLSPGTTDEVTTMRALLEKLESGEIEIRKRA